MRHIVPSSKIVFTDLIILVLSVVIGINSIMTFEEKSRETLMPFVSLPRITAGNKHGLSRVQPVKITIQKGPQDKIYYYHNQRVDLEELLNRLKNTRATSAVIRADRQIQFGWEEFCRLTQQLMQTGVKNISYATIARKE